MSLLKPYTIFEKIKNMTLDEMACHYPCPYSKDFDVDECCKHKDCIECTKQWLESEAEENGKGE